jgi:hypothetical protein
VQPAHLVDKHFHNNDCGYRKKDFIVLYSVYLKDNKAFGKQIQFLIGIEQEIVFPAFVVVEK